MNKKAEKIMATTDIGVPIVNQDIDEFINRNKDSVVVGNKRISCTFSKDPVKDKNGHDIYEVDRNIVLQHYSSLSSFATSIIGQRPQNDSMYIAGLILYSREEMAKNT